MSAAAVVTCVALLSGTAIALGFLLREVAIRWLDDRRDARVKRCSEAETKADAALAMASANDAKTRGIEKLLAQLNAPRQVRK